MLAIDTVYTANDSWVVLFFGDSNTPYDSLGNTLHTTTCYRACGCFHTLYTACTCCNTTSTVAHEAKDKPNNVCAILDSIPHTTINRQWVLPHDTHYTLLLLLWAPILSMHPSSSLWREQHGEQNSMLSIAYYLCSPKYSCQIFDPIHWLDILGEWF